MQPVTTIALSLKNAVAHHDNNDNFNMNPIHLFSHSRSRTRTLLIALGACLLGSTANAWWDADWSQRKQLTLDTGASGANLTAAVTEAPVLVRLHIGNFNFPAAREDGADLRFIAADDQTPLPYHIAQYDALLGEAFVWVKLPDLEPAAEQAFWLYYGNPAAGYASSAKATYDAHTKAVYHFGERGQPARDYSGNDNHALNAGIPIDGSLIGTGIHFDGKRSIELPASESLRVEPGSSWTYSFWAKPATLADNAIVYSRQDGEGALRIGFNEGIPFAEVTTAAGTSRTPAAEPVAAGSWSHIAVSTGNGETILYLNGERYAATTAQLPALSTPAHIGAEAAQGADFDGFAGDLVEFSIADTMRPQPFIAFAARSQGGTTAATTLRFAEDESSGGGGHSGYFTVILQSLTFDGWVVVVLCAIMAVISWIVMLVKNTYITNALKGNALFVRVFNNHVASDLTILDNPDTHNISSMGGSLSEGEKRIVSRAPLYRLYHVGAEEIRKRLEGGFAAQSGSKSTESDTATTAAPQQKEHKKSLSPHAINAIVASLDGAQVRETQKLNKQIVLLTIAISGGPFLGLLGTVVGVMITFAAVAMAGDVNVNAIAPGIAAALLATVAGLAVAIPALFGYNYLLSRIKEVTADMQVFSDEFITKVAEFYPDDSARDSRANKHN